MSSKPHFAARKTGRQQERRADRGEDSAQDAANAAYQSYGKVSFSEIRRPVRATFVRETDLPSWLPHFLTSMRMSDGSNEGSSPVSPRLPVPVNLAMDIETPLNFEEFLDDGLMPEGALRSEDLVFLSDCARCWVVRLSDISIFEAEENYTRAFMSAGTVLIRRPLRECALRLDPHVFFRARRNCIVNLGQVRQARFIDPVRLVFVFHNGKEVVLSRKQSLVFRRTRSL